jgi:hypothetical protein
MDQAPNLPIRTDPADFAARGDMTTNIETQSGIPAQSFEHGIPNMMDTSMTAPAIPEGISAGRDISLPLHEGLHLTSSCR